MEIKSTITAIVAAVVALIIVVVVAIPIISDTTNQVHGYAQNSDYSFSFIESDNLNDITIIMDPTQSILTVNDKVMYSDIVNSDNPSECTIYTDNGYLRINGNQVYGMIGETIQASSTATITIDNGTLNLVVGSKTETVDINWLCYPDPNGNWGSFYNESVNINVNTDFYAIKISTYKDAEDANTPYTVIRTNGTTDTVLCSIYDTKSTETGIVNTTSATLSYEYEQVDRWHGTFSSVKIATEYGSYTEEAANARIIAPIEYYYEEKMDGAIISMINIVPLLMIIGIIVGVTAIFIRTR